VRVRIHHLHFHDGAGDGDHFLVVSIGVAMVRGGERSQGEPQSQQRDRHHETDHRASNVATILPPRLT
jgi:hypothetical protein